MDRTHGRMGALALSTPTQGAQATMHVHSRMGMELAHVPRMHVLWSKPWSMLAQGARVEATCMVDMHMGAHTGSTHTHSRAWEHHMEGSHGACAWQTRTESNVPHAHLELVR